LNPQLLSITFNLSPGDVTRPSVTLRRNMANPVVIPEWRLGETFAPEDCPVAYSNARIRGQPVSIRVRMRGPAGRRFSIRALGPDWLQQAELGCSLVFLYWLLPAQKWQQFSVLGQVPVFGIAFPQSKGAESMTEAEVTVDLRQHTIGSLGVWVSNTSWRWQFNEGLGPWTDIVTTSHRIFCLVDHPTLPWQQDYMDGSNRRLPWVDALEFACSWAAGARGYDAVLTAIVRGIWNAGSMGLFRYEPDPFPAFASSGVVGSTFALTDFLGQLRRPAGTRSIDCYGCAAATSTFADLLGLDLSQQAFTSTDAEARVLLIGHDGLERPSWNEHEVAKGTDGRVWDACLQLNTSPEPSVPGSFIPQGVYGIDFTEYKRRFLGARSAASASVTYNGRRDLI
jgi:hypothetical protein